MPNKDDLLNVAQAAELLGITPRAVRHRILAGTLPATKLGPGTASYAIRRGDVEAVLSASAASA